MIYQMIEDPGHGWLRVPLKEIVGMTFSKFSYADGEFAYLEEDCDAPKFMEAKSISHEDIATTFIEANCFVRRLGGLPREFILKEQTFEECGCCGHYHLATFRGDCREDSERFTIDEIPEGSEVIDLESLMAEETEMQETLNRLLKITDGCREDMHEPDEQGLSADVHGHRLDNAFPPAAPTHEFRVKLVREHGTGDFVRLDTEYFNLATLIALARKANLETEQTQ